MMSNPDATYPVFDDNGNPNVMGSRPVSESQAGTIKSIHADFNALHARISGTPGANAEAARLFAVARTHLELACMAATKAISRS